MKLTLASGRSSLPFTGANVTIASGGYTTASRTLYFSIQGENPLGLSLPSTILGPFTVNIGEKVSIVPPGILPGEGWINFVVSASLSNNPESFVQVGKIPVFTIGGQINTQPLILSTDASFSLSATVATTIDLPASGSHGMMRGILSSGLVYEYNTLTQAWVKCNRLFNTYIADITKINGCAQDIRYLSDFVPPNYLDDGSKGVPIRFWMINDTTVPESAGKRLGMVVKLNEEIKTNYFDKKLWLVFRGYFNTVTNTPRVKDSYQNTFDYVDQEIPFDANNASLVLQDSLLPGEAFVVEVYPRFNLNLVSGTQVKVYPFFYEEAGEYSEAGEIIGDAIYGSGDRCLVVPSENLSVKVLSGKGMINSFNFRFKDEKVIFGLKANTPMQAIAIDGNGYCRIVDALNLQNDAIRAYVSTIDGIGFASNWSNDFYIPDNKTFVITCNYPVLNGLGKVRSNYPDIKIVGNTKAVFNPSSVVAYIKRLSDNQIRSFDLGAVTQTPSQSFNVSNWASGKIVTVLPMPESVDFGLFSASSCSLSIGVGISDVSRGYYQVAYAFKYKNAVTSISHDESKGCITTINVGFADVISRSAYWAEPTASINELSLIPITDVATGQHRSVLSPLDVFRYDSYSLAIDNGKTIIRPADTPSSSPGRWIAVRDPKIPFVTLSKNQDTLAPLEDDVILYFSDENKVLAKSWGGGINTFTFLEKSQVFHQAQAVEPINISFNYQNEIYLNMVSSNRFTTLVTTNSSLIIQQITRGYAFELKIQQGSDGGNTLIFPPECKFPNGINPSISSDPGKIDILSCICFEDEILYCSLAKGF